MEEKAITLLTSDKKSAIQLTNDSLSMFRTPMGFAYKFHDPDSVYFVTCATVQWADVFTRSIYSDIVVDSLQYCIDKKGLVLHAWVIMPNHIHLVISRNGDSSLSYLVRDFKKFTS